MVLMDHFTGKVASVEKAAGSTEHSGFIKVAFEDGNIQMFEYDEKGVRLGSFRVGTEADLR